jgi:hypothetical protein
VRRSIHVWALARTSGRRDLKIPNSRAAHRHFDTRRNPDDHYFDPVVPDKPGPDHAYVYDPNVRHPPQDWILKETGIAGIAFLEGGAEESACGMGVRIVYARAFDTDDAAACPRCVEIAMLWATSPSEFRRRVEERHERWRQREEREYEAIDASDLLRQEAYGTDPIDDGGEARS